MYGSEPTMVPACVDPAGRLARREQHGEAEVEDLRLTVGRQRHVARLEVAMEDAVPVRVLERIGDGRAEVEHSIDAAAARREPRLERAAGHVLHDQEVVPVLGIEVEDGGDAGVRETGEHQRLAAKSLAGGRIDQRAAQEHLDGDDAVQVGVVRLPHLAHAARADALDEPVTSEHGAGTDGDFTRGRSDSRWHVCL